MSLLDGKTGLVLNIANDRSIAAYIGHHAVKEGATIGVGFLPMGGNLEKSERRARKAMQEHGYPDAWISPCDVGIDESIEKFFAAAKEQFGTIDFLVHSLAFADYNYLKTDAGVFTSTPRKVFQAGARHQCLQPDRPDAGGRAADARGWIDDRDDLSRQRKSCSRLQHHGRCQGGVGIHGPVSGLRPRKQKNQGEHDFRRPDQNPGGVRCRRSGRDARPHGQEGPAEAKCRRREVGKTAVYLLSDLSSGVTGENIYVDAGFNTVGL